MVVNRIHWMYSCCLISSLWLCLFVSSTFAQSEPAYPRIGVQHFGKAPADWYSRFGLVIIPRNNGNEVNGIKALNPKTKVLWTTGWTAWGSGIWYFSNIPEEWFAVDSKGEKISLNWGAVLLDMSNFCPKVNGKRYNEGHPEFLVSNLDLSVFDGIASDWCWGKPHGVSDIDLDRNGKNDYNEHGKSWVDSRWQEGVETFIANVRNLIGPDKLMWVNSGGFQDWGWNDANGLELERFGGIQRWSFVWKRYQQFLSNAREPRILMMDVRPSGADPDVPDPTKNHFKLMRFLLTVTLLGDGYFEFNPVEAGEHHYYTYYDEFDVKLGFPTKAAQELPNGCWVRFFDNGVAITNPTGSTQEVTDTQLSALPGYAGPYFRFRGNQDPDFNNGDRFRTVTLTGNYISNSDLTLGDGILLLNEATAIVSDIMIDNLPFGTSPAQSAAQLNGLWEQTKEGGDYYSQHVRPSKNRYPHAFTEGGNGSDTATFTPTISVAGNYEVFEWHGHVPGAMATNVPYTIHYGNGKNKSVVVDQSQNQGKWNSLGTYSFPSGNASNVEISNDANGRVVADVVRFVYRGNGNMADVTPPSAPTGVKVGVSN